MRKTEFANIVHDHIARSSLLVRIAVKLRNQCNMIISRSLTDGINIQNNGEAYTLRGIAPFCDTFMDIGANKGEWSEAAYKSGIKRGILVEPNQEAYEYLKRKWSNIDGVEVRDWVLGEKRQSVNYYYSDGFDPKAGVNVRRENCSVLNMTTIDNEAVSADIIKMDVEGNECDVVKGAQNLFTLDKVKFVQFEYNSMWINGGATLTWLVAHLKKNGYSVYSIRRRGLVSLNLDYYGEHFGYMNCLAVNKQYERQVATMVVR